MGKLRFGGMLCDDHVHVKAKELVERNVETWKYKQKKTLTRMANNETFSDETRQALWKAIHNIDEAIWWRNLYIKEINKEFTLRFDDSDSTTAYNAYHRWFCKTCGAVIGTDNIYCNGCGKVIDWGEDDG